LRALLAAARALDADSDALTLAPDGRFAVCLHDRGNGADCFGAVGKLREVSRSRLRPRRVVWRWSVGPAGYPSRLRLDSVALEGDAVVVG